MSGKNIADSAVPVSHANTQQSSVVAAGKEKLENEQTEISESLMSQMSCFSVPNNLGFSLADNGLGNLPSSNTSFTQVNMSSQQLSRPTHSSINVQQESFSRTPGSKKTRPFSNKDLPTSQLNPIPFHLNPVHLQASVHNNNHISGCLPVPLDLTTRLVSSQDNLNASSKYIKLVNPEISSSSANNQLRYNTNLLQQDLSRRQQFQATILQPNFASRVGLSNSISAPSGLEVLASSLIQQSSCSAPSDFDSLQQKLGNYSTVRSVSNVTSTPISSSNSDLYFADTSAFKPIGCSPSWQNFGSWENISSQSYRTGHNKASITNISSRSFSPLSKEDADTGVALSVTNLDYNISAREWRKILHTAFQQYVQVVNVFVHHQPDGTNMGVVYVPTKEEARYAIMQCHRRKIGYKRIYVSLQTNDSTNQTQRIRSEVVSVLTEVSGNILPLFKFIENYEKRFHRSISVSELYHMKDTVEIKEHVGKGRMVCLHLNSTSSQFSYDITEEKLAELQEKLYCELHCSQSEFTLLEESGMLPYVKLELGKFAKNVHTLLQLHDGVLPLMSFGYCYAAAFAAILSVTIGGVPLEHLITCVSDVQVKITKSGVKKVMWIDSRPCSPASSILSETSSNDSFSSRTGPSLNQKLSQFSREVVDLLKRMPGCQMAFSKFIPSYHHHFGRQCRVADYGYSKLIELFEAVPHVLQVLGTGGQRILYLTHRIHLRRFTADLLRVLKAQPEKNCKVSEFPSLYKEVMGHELMVNTFGVCYIQDMLSEISETQVLVTGSGNSATMCIPRKDQTPEEIERTKQFGHEVIDLLKNCPQCTMIFNKFIPAYHHHFGRQCRVSDYGFTKLVELFEAIPEVVALTENAEERYISLTKPELYKVLTEQMVVLLRSSPGGSVEVDDFCLVYQRQFGHNIHIDDFGVDNVVDLAGKVSNIAMVETRGNKQYIVMRNRSTIQYTAAKCFELLMEKCNGEMRLSKFIEKYKQQYCEQVDLVTVKHELFPAIEIKEDYQSGVISLHPLLDVARRVKTLLRGNQGKLNLLNFELAYRQNYGVSLTFQQYGFPGVTVMLQVMDFMVSIRGRGARQTILLRQDYLYRLSHQVAYKIGIFAELVKTKQDQPTVQNSTGSDSGILDDSSLIRNENILTCSPDLMPLVNLTSDIGASAHPIHSSQRVMSDISYDLPSPDSVFGNLSLGENCSSNPMSGSSDSLFSASQYLPQPKRQLSDNSLAADLLISQKGRIAANFLSSEYRHDS